MKFICTNPASLIEWEPDPEDELINDKYGSEFCSEECKQDYEEMEDW